jgi:hypothetical protein
MPLPFEPIQFDRQGAYRKALAACPQPASDYSFLNLWGWAEEYGLQWAWGEDLVWIQQTRPFVKYWAPIGNWRRIDWQARFQAGPDADATFIRVPEKLVECWQKDLGERLQVEEERENWDYLYAFEDLVQLKGNRYHKKKNLLNQFLKSYEFEYQPFGVRMIEQAMAMQEDWCAWRDCESSEVLAAENRAILRVLERWDRIDHILGGAIFIDQIIVAYALAEALTGDTILIHFEKGCPDYKGVYQAINQMFLSHTGDGFKLVNREQDLGNPGLRKAKLSYHPVDFLRKYRVQTRR